MFDLSEIFNSRVSKQTIEEFAKQNIYLAYGGFPQKVKDWFNFNRNNPDFIFEAFDIDSRKYIRWISQEFSEYEILRARKKRSYKKK